MEHEDLKHEGPRRYTKVHEEDMDAQLLGLFRRVQPPAPSVGFAARTMNAVMREALPAGRRPLSSPLAAFLGWVALIAGVAISAWAVAVNQPLFASGFTKLVSNGIGVGVWLTQFTGAGLALLDVFNTTGLAVSRAVVTKEGSAGLLMIAVIGALSLSALHRLLLSEIPAKGVSPWQEL